MRLVAKILCFSLVAAVLTFSTGCGSEKGMDVEYKNVAASSSKMPKEHKKRVQVDAP